MVDRLRKNLLFCLVSTFLIASGCARIPEPIVEPEPANQVSPALETGTPDLQGFFQNHSGSFVLYDQANDRYLRYSPEKASEGLLPASTFKILNALIALETGVVPDENFMIPWDGTEYPRSSWNRDHTLKSAIQNSVVWYFQEVARRIGRERMQQYVDAAGYGNGDISGNLDSFWLDGGLRISADEQVEFLKRLYKNELPFSARSMEIVKTILALEETAVFRESGKTGSTRDGSDNIGWFVGYVEKDENVYYFAANLRGPEPEIDGAKAREIAENILRSLGILGEPLSD